MERLTTRNTAGVAVYKYPFECKRCGETIYRLPDYGNGSPTEKLAAYEDAEEQGRYGRWIPVSERLPEKREDVLVCFDDVEGCVIAWYAPHGGVWRNSSTGIALQTLPIAWMPLPEPYRESEGK